MRLSTFCGLRRDQEQYQRLKGRFGDITMQIPCILDFLTFNTKHPNIVISSFDKVLSPTLQTPLWICAIETM